MARQLETVDAGLASFGSVADNLREQPEEIGAPWLAEIAPIFDALFENVGQILEAEPEYTIPILEQLARSDSVTTRYVATKLYPHAYAVSPEGSRALITRLLTDSDRRIQEITHEVLSSWVDEQGDMSRDLISLDFVTTLPIENVSVEIFKFGDADGPRGVGLYMEPSTHEYRIPTEYGFGLRDT